MRWVKPARVEGVVAAPPSKSVAQRAIAAAQLSDGSGEVWWGSHIAKHASDIRAALECVRQLGAAIAERDDRVVITPGRPNAATTLPCGESGLCLRLFSPIAALYDVEVELSAAGSLKRRPVGAIVEPLTRLGARCSTEQGLAPVVVRGPMRGGSVDYDDPLTSQILTGLLMALPRAPADSEIRVASLVSAPYVRLTVRLMRTYGVEVEHDAALTRFCIPGGQRYRPSAFRVEGDWSAAAFMLVAGAIAGKVTVRNLDCRTEQADVAVLEVLERCGAELTIGADQVTVEQNDLEPFRFDASDCPDLFPPLVALAAACRGASRIDGVGRLVHKESDRARALVGEYSRLGASIDVDADRLTIRGGALEGGTVDSHNDHRIAMSLALAGLCARGPVGIEAWRCVDKSYPTFFGELSSLISA